MLTAESILAKQPVNYGLQQPSKISNLTEHSISKNINCTIGNRNLSRKMAPTAQPLRIIMALLLLCSYSIDDASAKHHNTTTTRTIAPCLPDQAYSLLQLKRSFIRANLSSWRDGKDCCHWEGVTCDMASGRVVSLNLGVDPGIRRIGPAVLNLTSLKSLSLGTAGISEGLISSLSKLSSLNSLELHGSNSWNPQLSSVGNIKELISLRLEAFDFSKSSPPSWIGSLKSLTYLGMYGCNFSGPLPYQIGNLANLTQLEIARCNYTGQPIPSWIKNLTRLTKLGIQDCESSAGSIPPTIGNLTKLEVIHLRHNNLAGKIPKSLFALPSLQVLCLNNNQLSGHLEDIPSPVSSPLSTIELNDNQLSGCIPKSILQLKHLQYLNLESNRLSDTIKLSSFWRLKSLHFLSLSNNKLSIMTDKESDDVSNSLPNIHNLYLASCNVTKFPASLRYLNTVSVLDLSNNKMNDAIPSWVWENWKDQLESLNLSRNMFTTLEKSPSLVHMSRLTVLDLSFNRLQGSIPIPVTPMPGNVLDYSNNNFSSIVPNFGRYIRSFYLNLSNNRLNGHVPSSICGAINLSIMDLSYNNFSGSLPSCLIERGNIAVLKLRHNQISGPLPENIKEECKFQTIDLNGNQIQGTLPRSLLNCQELSVLDVGNNQVIGSFPSWLGILPNLRVLVLRSNQLNGTIKNIKSDHRISNHFASLQILCLSSNRFSGRLPKDWFNTFKAMMENVNEDGQVLGYYTNTTHGFYQDMITITLKGSDLIYSKILTTFKAVDFSNNSFDGPIPESVGSLVSLHGFNISSNNFTGHIPSTLSNLSQMESLDLSQNQLSGEIPQELTSLTYLAWLNLSHNNLVGRIPQGNQFLSFPSSSFEGNMGLCGSPLSKQCESTSSIASSMLTHPKCDNLCQDRRDTILLFSFVGLGFGVGFSLAILFTILAHKRMGGKHW